MIILRSKLFDKTFKKLSKSIRIAFYERVKIFIADPFSPLVENHALKGTRRGQRSINVSGDYRAVFEEQEKGVVLFVAIGRHRDLYK